MKMNEKCKVKNCFNKNSENEPKMKIECEKRKRGQNEEWTPRMNEQCKIEKWMKNEKVRSERKTKGSNVKQRFAPLRGKNKEELW